MLRSQAHKYLEEFKAICPSIQFDLSSVTIGPEGVMMDIRLFIREDGTIGYNVYQKPMNIYQYLTPKSMHSKRIFQSFILNELKRYRLLCTDDDAYDKQINLFYSRLLPRGYPMDWIHKAVADVPSREDLLERCRERRLMKEAGNDDLGIGLHKTKIRQPILITCLPQFYDPIRREAFSFQTESLIRFPYDFTSSAAFKARFDSEEILSVRQNLPNIGKIVVRAKIKRSNSF